MGGTGVIDNFLGVFTSYIDSGFGLLGGEVAFIATTLIVIDVTLAALFWSWGADDDIIARLVKKTLFVGVFAYLIGNWNNLAQIIFEEESKGETLLPVEFLRQLISFYGDSMQSMVPSYLQMSMETFARQHQAMRDKMAGAMGEAMGGNSMAMLEEQAKRNMAMFQQAMSMFTPFSTGASMGDMPGAPSQESSAKSDDVQALRAELDAMRQKLDQLASKE